MDVDIFSWLGGAASLISLIAAVIGFLLTAFYKRLTMMSKEIAYSKEATIDKLREEISMLQSSITRVPEGEQSQVIESQVMTGRLDNLEGELRGLKELLFGNPEVAVTIPLMKKDIEALAEQNKALRNELDRQGASTKWFLGILITMSIGLFGLAISILLK